MTPKATGHTHSRHLALAAALAAALLGLLAQRPLAAAQFALVVNGDDSFTHNQNVALALTTLPHLGYARADTLVLAPAAATTLADAQLADESTASPAPTAAPLPFWRRDATNDTLRQAIATLHDRMGPDDVLLVYLTGHAYRAFGHTVLGLRHGTLHAEDLMQQLARLPFGKLILIADPCYSGGFVTAAVALGRNVVAVSSADDRHEVRCEPFVRPLWLAAAAADKPGPVSIEAAFQLTAAQRRAAGDNPQYAATGACAGHENTFAR